MVRGQLFNMIFLFAFNIFLFCLHAKEYSCRLHGFVSKLQVDGHVKIIFKAFQITMRGRQIRLKNLALPRRMCYLIKNKMHCHPLVATTNSNVCNTIYTCIHLLQCSIERHHLLADYSMDYLLPIVRLNIY